MQESRIGDTDTIRVGLPVTDSEKLHPSNSDAARELYAGLVRQAAGGDAEAMERLLMKAQEAAYRFSLIVCGHQEDAEDVMQDALIKTYRHVGDIEEPEAFRTWLYRTVRNACLMKRRRRVHEPASHLPLDATAAAGSRALEVADASRPADQRLIDSWLGSRLRGALATLDPPLRAIVVLREIEGLSTREVAQILKLSEANVKTRLHRARVRLRQQLGRANVS
jgi:RNA polymerase sigma-70 factor (ECF subfamily)